MRFVKVKVRATNEEYVWLGVWQKWRFLGSREQISEAAERMREGVDARLR